MTPANDEPPCTIDLVAFDIDGTLIAHPSGRVVWQELHRRFGADGGGDDTLNRKRYDDFLAGRLAYEDWVRLDVQDWQRAGARREDLRRIFGEFRLLDGVRDTLAELSRRGYRLAAISGTLDFLIEVVFPDHPFERVYSNRISFSEDGRISGWQATPFDFDGKAKGLLALSRELSVPPERIAFVGDDINDIGVAQAAGFSVAVRPKPESLAAVCDVVLSGNSLAELLVHFP